MHLYHERPYVDREKWRRNRELRRRIRREGVTRAPRGLAELRPDPMLRIDPAPHPLETR